jgi:hypothetical protein
LQNYGTVNQTYNSLWINSFFVQIVQLQKTIVSSTQVTLHMLIFYFKIKILIQVFLIDKKKIHILSYGVLKNACCSILILSYENLIIKKSWYRIMRPCCSEQITDNVACFLILCPHPIHNHFLLRQHWICVVQIFKHLIWTHI